MSFKKDEMLLSDGGILNNFPSNLVRDKCNKLIGVFVSPLQDVEKNQLFLDHEIFSRRSNK